MIDASRTVASLPRTPADPRARIPPAKRRDPSPEPPRDTGGGWFESSHDLLKGAEVIEDPAALDDDLIDALFPPPRAPAKPTR